MIEGRCDDRFAAVRDAFEANLTNGQDVGASVAATIDGELVVDLWGGHVEVAKSAVGARHDHQRVVDDEDGRIEPRVAEGPALDRVVEIPWRRAEIPAANGHGNARSVAVVQSIVSNGGTVGGREFLSRAGVDAPFEVQSAGDDLVLGSPIRFGMGYGLNGPEMPISPNPRACSWGGFGGSLALNDLDARMTFSYVMNRMGESTTGDLRGASLLMAMAGATA
jgi:CubicO group peptidase (beta-lactamase class C family)